MNRNDYGQKAEIIGQMTDVNQLMGLLKNPQYAGFTNVIIARLTELNKMKQAPQAQQPPAPTVAQQAVAGQAPPDQPAMARGGIIAFKHGGEVRKFAKGKVVKADDSDASYDPYGSSFAQFAGETPAEAQARLLRGMSAPDIPEDYVPTEDVAHLNAMGRLSRIASPSKTYSSPGSAAFDDTYSGADEAGGPLPELLDKEKRQALAARAAALPTTTPYTPITEKQLGLPSLDAASLLVAQKNAGGGGRDLGSFKDYYDAINALAGDNPDAEAQRAEIAKNKKNALNFALMHAGLGMAQSASEHPTYGFAGNLASGAGAGLGAYEKTETEQNAAQRELARLDRQEKLGIAGLAVGERGQDVRAARNDAMQRAAIAAQLKGPALQEANIRALAVALANEDRAKGVMQPLPYYHQKAWEAYNAGITRAGMGADAAMARARIATAQKQLASGMGTPAQQALWQRVIDSEGQFNPDEVPIPLNGASTGAPIVRPQR